MSLGIFLAAVGFVVAASALIYEIFFRSRYASSSSRVSATRSSLHLQLEHKRY